MDRVEPERELIRRALPSAPVAILTALLVGAAVGGWPSGLSAAIGVGVVFANFAAHGWSLARAAAISVTVLGAVAMGGFIVRLAVIIGLMVVLDRFAFFTPLAFILAVVPATVLLLAFEMRQLRGRMLVELWSFSPPGSVRR